jgi:hypothetical protein
MDADDARELELALRSLAIVLGGATLVLVAWRARLAAARGTPRVVVLAPRRLRWAYLAAAALTAAWLLAANPGVPVVPALSVLVLAALLVSLAPGSEDSLLGSHGVQHGWHARRFADLEEWRLTGDHLRWRLFDEWLAAHAPAELHAELRAQLTAANAGRESRFQR